MSRGFTLYELVVVCSIAPVVVIAASQLYLTVASASRSSAVTAHTIYEMDRTSRALDRDVDHCIGVEEAGLDGLALTTVGGSVRYTVSDGVLTRHAAGESPSDLVRGVSTFGAEVVRGARPDVCVLRVTVSSERARTMVPEPVVRRLDRSWVIADDGVWSAVKGSGQ